MRTRIRGLGLALLLALAPVAVAQDGGGPPRPPAERDSLEMQVRRRVTEMLRTQLGLNDEQMRRLAETNRKFERRRVVHLTMERQIRTSLRQSLESGDTTQSERISVLLDQMLAVQRQRLELVEAEQKELATFLTPVQRAKYFGMEEQIRRRLMEMRERQMRGGDGPRRPGTPAPTRGGRRPPG